MTCVYCAAQYSAQTYGAFCSAECRSEQFEELDLGYLLIEEEWG